MNRTHTMAAPAALFGAVILLAWGALSPGSEPPVVGAIPAGIIVGWAGTPESIPAGWQLCDGTRGTPDLRGRFILAASTEQEVGEKGGQTSYTTSQNQRHTTKLTRGGGFATLDPTGGPGTVNSVSMHTHTVSVTPSYYKLAFIMKLADE